MGRFVASKNILRFGSFLGQRTKRHHQCHVAMSDGVSGFHGRSIRMINTGEMSSCQIMSWMEGSDPIWRVSKQTSGLISRLAILAWPSIWILGHFCNLK